MKFFYCASIIASVFFCLMSCTSGGTGDPRSRGMVNAGDIATNTSLGTSNTTGTPLPITTSTISDPLQSSPLSSILSQTTLAVASFAAINTILSTDCGGENCHGSGSRYGVYVDNEGNVQNDKVKIISSLKDGSMPPRSSTSISSTDMLTLLQYLSQ